jgi:hypothetical protein
MTIGESIQSIRKSFKEGFSSNFSNSLYRYKNTRAYNSIEAMYAYKDMFETLSNA